MKKIILILMFSIFSSLVLAESKTELSLEIYNNKAQRGTCHTLKTTGSDG